MSLFCSTGAPTPKCLCVSEKAKLIGAADGMFPDFGHHSEREMGGLWMHPIKVLDGFWLRFRDEKADQVDTWIIADRFFCLPHKNVFDYGANLGHTRVTIRQERLAPESAPGVVVRYRFTNHDDEPRAVTAELMVRTELYPVWYSIDSGAYQDGPDEGEWEAETRTFHAKDRDNPWFAGVQCQTPPTRVRTGRFFGPQQTAGQGVSASFLYKMTLAAGEERVLTFYMTGSAVSWDEVEDNLALLSSGRDFEQEKQARYDRLLGRSRLSVGEPRLEEVWQWIKINTDWLTVDAGPFGRALAAGLPEYPWWFGCDNCYAIQGLLAMGEYRLARETLKLLADYSDRVNGNGRVVHEITTYGLCSNPGNTQETAHFVTAVWHYWRWTGDATLVEELLPFLGKAMAWLKAQDDDGDLFPSGYGIIEIAGLNAEMIDSIAYTVQAWQCYGEMCRAMGRPSEAEEAERMFRLSREALERNMWDEEMGSYCDAYASPAFVRSRRETILGRRRERTPEMEQAFDAMLARKTGPEDEEVGFLINGNWTLATAMETGLAPEARAARALAYLNTSDFVGPYGIYLNALDKGAMMTISTGAVAVAQARYGYGDRALELIRRMAATFGMANPGMMSEMSPDYGCVCQAWTAYALIVPVVRHMFGIQPVAGEQRIDLTPAMPSAWPAAELTHVRVLSGEISLRYQRRENGYTMTVETENCPAVRLCLRDGQRAEAAGAAAEGGWLDIPLDASGKAVVTVTNKQADQA